MIIVSDSVRNNLDEGCIKVASSLSKRLQKFGAVILAVNCECDFADKQVSTDKLFFSREIYSSMIGVDGSILYIPFASNTLGSALRAWNLRRKSGKSVTVLFTLRWDMSFLTKLVFKLSKVKIITISEETYKFFNSELKTTQITNIKTGVDSSIFIEVGEKTKLELRKKYGIPLDKTVILHVGHLKHGRNMDQFLNVDEQYHVLLVFSSVTEQDVELKKELLSKKNVQILEEYIPSISEIYQASDIYVFPVVEENNCIDVPLSVLEAAGCNKKILTTSYREIAFFEQVPGLMRVKMDETFSMKKCLQEIEMMTDVDTRSIAEQYDWDASISEIQNLVDGPQI